jgi:hypothetical protein
MRKNVIALLVLYLLFLGNAYAQENAGPKVCADLPGQTSGTYKFRRLGEAIEIPIRSANLTTSEAKEPASGASETPSDADCEPVAVELHWANGHNNGSNFNVTFLDNNNRLISAKQISAFMTGVLEFPLSSFEAQPVSGSTLSLVAIPSTVTIQAVPPFAAPVNLSYRITRVVRVTPRKKEPEKGEPDEASRGRERGQGNEIASIHNAVRLIGASRLPLVQIELKTSRPFPVRDIPLQLQIGKRVFVDELSGDYTGRKLTLSLTPEMFAELKDGDEIVAFFKPDRSGSADGDVWHFGKLEKGRRQ